MKKVQIFFSILLLAIVANAQYSYTTAGSVYSQNFDGLPVTGNSIAFPIVGSGPFDLTAGPFNGSNLTGWQFYKTGGAGTDAVFSTGTGSNNDGDVYSLGNTSSTNRALGTLPTSSGSTYAIGMVITNNTGVTLSSFTIGFTAEQWRNGSSAIANTWAFKYTIGSSLTGINQASLITNSNLDFASIVSSATLSALDGTQSANQTTKSFTITGLTWKNGDQLIFRWDDAAHSKSDAMAIDNFSFAAYPASINMYSWKGGTSGSYNVAANWTPNRNSVSSNDILFFNTAGSIAVDDVRAETIGNLIVSNAAVVTLKNTSAARVLSVSNNANICPGTSLTMGTNLGFNVTSAGSVNVNGTLNTNNTVTLKSDNTGTASVGISSGTINGTVTVERFIPAQRAYRLLAHPFSNNIAMSSLLPYVDITGQAGGGFTNSAGTNPSAYSYNTSTDTWQAYTSSGSTWNKGNGLLLFIRGKTGEGLSGANNATDNYTSGGPSDVTLTLSGTINTGTVTYTTGSGNTWNMVGNPYAGPIDVTQITNLITTAGGTNANIYVWDPAAQQTYKAAKSGAYIAKQLNASIIIPVYGAFLIKNTTGTAQTLTFTDYAKNISTTPLAIFGITAPKQTITLTIEKDNKYWDQLFIHFKNNASDSSVDHEDLEKFSNTNLNFYSISSDKKYLAVDTRSLLAKETNVLALGLTTSINAVYSLKANDINLSSNTVAYLQDKYLNQTVKIDNNLKYDFEVTADTASQGNNRFEIIIKQAVIPAAVISDNMQMSINPNPVTDYLLVTVVQQNNQPVNISIINSFGQMVKSIKSQQVSGSIKIPVRDLANGLYIVEVNNGNDILTQKILKINHY